MENQINHLKNLKKKLKRRVFKNLPHLGQSFGNTIGGGFGVVVKPITFKIQSTNPLLGLLLLLLILLSLIVVPFSVKLVGNLIKFTNVLVAVIVVVRLVHPGGKPGS